MFRERKRERRKEFSNDKRPAQPSIRHNILQTRECELFAEETKRGNKYV